MAQYYSIIRFFAVGIIVLMTILLLPFHILGFIVKRIVRSFMEGWNIH